MSSGTYSTNEVLSRLYKTQAYSDLTVICGDTSFRVHKNVLYLQSGCFEKEERSGIIRLFATGNQVENHDPDTIALMIECLYLGDYQTSPPSYSPKLESYEGDPKVEIGNGSASETPVNVSVPEVIAIPGDDSSFGISKRKSKKISKHRKSSALKKNPPKPCHCFLALHAKIFALGFEYDIPHLRQVSLAKFQAEVQETWQEPQFIEAISIAFETAPTDDGLRNAIVRLVIEKGSQLANNPEFERVLAEVPGLGAKLFKLKCQWMDAQRVCRTCKTIFISECKIDGCPPTAHKCDLDGPHKDCRLTFEWGNWAT